jgi:hypothetical protein
MKKEEKALPRLLGRQVAQAPRELTLEEMSRINGANKSPWTWCWIDIVGGASEVDDDG